MAVDAINATPSDPNANSYCTVAEADQYNTNHPYGSSWLDSDTTTKAQALILATELIDTHFEFYGSSSKWTQRLCWPRLNMEYRNGAWIPFDMIPDELKQATSEFARQLVAKDRTQDDQIETRGISSLNAAGVQITFRSPGPKVVPDAVVIKLSRWGYLRSSRAMRQLIR